MYDVFLNPPSVVFQEDLDSFDDMASGWHQSAEPKEAQVPQSCADWSPGHSVNINQVIRYDCKHVKHQVSPIF